MIAEVIPQAEDLVTKGYLDRQVERLGRRIDQVDRRIDQLEAKLSRWTLTFFAPMWLAVLATLVAIVVKS